LSAVAERIRRCRERQQLERSLLAAALAREVTLPELASELQELLSAGDLEALKWRLAGLASFHDSRNKRRDLDAYFTPPRVAAAVTDRVAEQIAHVPTPFNVLEPSAGLGAFVRTAIELFPFCRITAVDIKVRRKLRVLQPRAGLVHLDFMRFDVRGFDLILGNPPFKAAQEHIEHALELLTPGGHLAFILRLGFLSSIERAEGLWARPGLLHVATLAPRPSFIATGTDLSEYALFIWRRGYAGPVTLGAPICWKQPAAAARGAA